MLPSPRWRAVGKAERYPSEVQRIADRLAPTAKKRFLAAMAEMADSPEEAAIISALKAKDAAALARLFRVPLVPSQMSSVLATLKQAFNTAGTAAFRKVADRMSFRGSFNLVNPRAVKAAREQGAKLVKEVSDSTKAVIREFVTKGVDAGPSVQETARLLRGSIGLTDWQAAAVLKYRAKLLKEGRDAAQAARMSERYAGKLLRYRAETISRTETQFAVQRGQREAWRQAAEKKLFRRDKTAQTWSANPGACDQCRMLDGETVLFDTPFSNGLEGPPAHPRCRCTVYLQFL